MPHTSSQTFLRVDFPPFDINEWWDGKLEDNARWKYGTPPQPAMRKCAPLKSEGTSQVVSEARGKNASFAWVQHELHLLALNGSNLSIREHRADEVIDRVFSSRTKCQNGDTLLARSDSLRAHAIQNMVDTSGRQRVPYECCDNFQIAVPSSEVSRRFDEVTGPLMAKIKANSDQSRTLANLRDTLLPVLLGGSITSSP